MASAEPVITNTFRFTYIHYVCIIYYAEKIWVNFLQRLFASAINVKILDCIVWISTSKGKTYWCYHLINLYSVHGFDTPYAVYAVYYTIFLCMLFLLMNRLESQLDPEENFDEKVVSNIHYLIKLAQPTSVSCVIITYLHSHIIILIYAKTILLLLISRTPLVPYGNEMLLI